LVLNKNLTHNSQQSVTIIKANSPFSFGWKELWDYRELLFFFSWKEIKIRYKQAFLGVLWTILQPLCMMLVFVFLFSKGLHIHTGKLPAPLFYLSGLLIWNFFSSAVSNASNAMVANGNIIKKIYFPRLIIPISQLITASFDFIISLLFFLVLTAYYNIQYQLQTSWGGLLSSFLLAYLITFITAFGLGTFLSAINVKYRDVRYLLPFLIQGFFFITPVIYDTEIIENSFVQHALQLNPLSYAIQIIRSQIDANTSFPLFSWTILAVIIASYFIAIFTFRKTEAYFADMV
jgi:lipopolysaccharide transport system permease protein